MKTREGSLLCLLYIATVIGDDVDSNNRRPNIIFFLVDDMGWNDVGFHGLTQIPTANIDALAYNSIILNNYYSHPACSPSRSALMSGRYATSTGLQHVVIKGPQKVGLPLDLKTLPEHLNGLGYESHMIGKWHLGFYQKNYTPLKRGFKSHYGFWNGDSDHFFHTSVESFSRDELYGIPCYETRDNFKINGLNFRDDYKLVNKPGEYLTYLYTDRAKSIIKKHNKNKPLFLYLAHHGVHRGNFYLPVRAPEPLTKLFTNIPNNYTRGNFSGALLAIDLSLGDVMEALQQKGMLDNTIIVFSSDNGGPTPGEASWNGGSNFPLRGGKVTAWEGGVRINGFVWSSRFRNKGIVYNGMMHIVDWLPTLYKAAGGDIKNIGLDKLDAKDLWESIINNGPSPRTNVILQADSIFNLTGYRSGDYKFIQGQVGDTKANLNTYYGDPGREPPPPGVATTGSKTEKALKKQFGNDVKITGTPILLDTICMNVAQVEECDPVAAPCLFNIKEDPCERNNLANSNPTKLAELIEELRQQTVVNPNYPKGDYSADPVFYSGYWSPWVDINYNINSTSC